MVNPVQLFLGLSTLWHPQGEPRCSSLSLPRSRTFAGVELTSATYYPPGGHVKPVSERSGFIASNLTAFCRLELTVTTNSTTNSSARAELWLPDKWNKRLLGLGSPDSYWSFPYAALSATGLNSSFATFAVAATPSDKGEDVLADLGGRALHRALEVSRTLTKKYYGRWKSVRSYFAGVEMGGTAGLRSALGSPGDFDGILIGAPVLDFVAGGFRAETLAPLAKDVMNDKLWKLVHKEVMKQCDAIDGVLDGVIEDPRSCHFRPEVLTCRDGKKKKCLTPPQLKAVRKIYSPHYNADEEIVFNRVEPGGELSFHAIAARSFPTSCTITEYPSESLGGDLIMEAVQAVFTLDVDASQLNASSPNLLPFAKKGCKLLHYFGFSDPNIAPQDSLSYHASVVEHTKRFSSKNVDDFYRLFPVPGMDSHLSGPGFGAPFQSTPSLQPFVGTHDIVRALVDWVEKGKVPEVLVAASWRAKGKGVERTRKLCRFPKRAVFQGGDEKHESSFKCA